MKEYKFTATLQDAGGGGVYVSFPYDVKQEFGKSRVPIQCTIDGEPYRGTMVKYGEPLHMILVLKSIREKIGKQAGDKVKIWLKEDTQERTIEIPDDLLKLLKKNKLLAAFEKKSFTQRKEWAVAVTGAKRPETRLSRLNKIIEQLGKA
jgi:hypothetical protein